MLWLADLRSLDATRIGGVRLLDHARELAAAKGGDGATEPPQAALLVAAIASEAIALGAFQRARSTLDLAALEGSGLSLVRRRSGGPALRVGRGQVYVSLELMAPEALGGVRDPQRALNRHVRPLLRALTSLGDISVTSGGRDLILARGVPVGWVGVAHTRATRRTTLEAVIALRKPFALEPSIDLAHGAVPRSPVSTLEEAHGRPIPDAAVVDAIARAFGAATALDPPRLPASRVDSEERPFTAMIAEAIGLLGAVVEGDSIAIGGDLMASDDALGTLGKKLFLLRDATEEDVLATIRETFDEDALLFGVRDLASIAKLVRATKSSARE